MAVRRSYGKKKVDKLLDHVFSQLKNKKKEENIVWSFCQVNIFSEPRFVVLCC